jgi:hypothetical protein
MKTGILAGAVALMTLAGQAALAGDTPSADGASVYFVGLQDGDSVSSPVTIRFGLRGMGVAPAGAEWDNTGHHHLLINTDAFTSADSAKFADGIPSDDHHKHFGGGQTEVTLDLPKGEHTLQLLLGDLYHVPHQGAVYSDQIRITVD